MIFFRIPSGSISCFTRFRLTSFSPIKNTCLDSQKLTIISNRSYALDERQKRILGRGLPKRVEIPGVKNIILVCSGKGGVGKSTTSVNLAVSLAILKENLKIGLLDTDVYGPSIPSMMNLVDQPVLSKDSRFLPLENFNVKCMSMGFLVEQKAALMWRGLMVMSAMNKLLRQVDWGELDCLIVDTPPGTGDVLLSLVQSIPIAGVVLVTTPQNTAVQVTRRGALMLQKLGIPIAGIVQNMSHAKCPKCSHKFSIYVDTVTSLSNELGVPILCHVPLNGNLAKFSDEGTPALFKDSNGDVAQTYLTLAQNVLEYINKGSEESDSRTTVKA